MTVLEISVLKKIIENILDDYTVKFHDGNKSFEINDKFEVDVSLKNLILKKY